MDEPLSEGKENVIDVFILSSDETVALQLTELLEQKDYRVTIFPDGAQLKETLRSGKPNLLICDTRTPELEGFEVCRQIKADNDLWIIPILILTGTNTIEDLLKVLDCNADNFVTQPFDSPYHLSLIEGMLGTPVERLTTEQTRTQFKISHDERTYVVAANRRKLLEYLLSAFEIAVSKSTELSHLTSVLSDLSGSVKVLEQTVTEYNHAIEIVNATVQQKEQKIVTLIQQCEELRQSLKQKNDEIGNLKQERDADKALITSRDETIRAMSQEHDNLLVDHRVKAEALTSQISALVAESDTRKTSHDTVQHALNEETTRSASLETALRALTLEHEQLQSACAAEKNRADSAEREIGAVMQAKSQSEQDLARKITELNGTAEQQVAELIRLKGEIETETNRRVLSEQQVVLLQREYEQSASSVHAEMDTLRQQVGTLQENLTASAEAIENEENIIKSQKEHLAGVIAEKEKIQESFKSVSNQLTEAQATIAADEQKRKSLVDNLEEVIAEKERTEDQLQSVLKELAEARADVTTQEQKVRSLEDTLKKAVAEKEKSEIQAKTVSTALDTAQSEIETERNQRCTIQENLDRIIREHDNALGILRREFDGVQTDLDVHKGTLEQRENDLIATRSICEMLKRDLESAKTKNRALEEELSLAAEHRVQSGQQSRTLADDLEQVKAALETEQRLRRISEEKTKSAVQQYEDLEQHFHSALEEMECTKKDRAAALQQFKEELETAGRQIKSLEAHITVLSQEKLNAEQDVQTLTAKLGQAGTTLADEYKRHGDVDERDTAANDEQLAVQQSISRADGSDTLEGDVQQEISKEPNLPVPEETGSQSVSAELTPAEEKIPGESSLETLPDAEDVAGQLASDHDAQPDTDDRKRPYGAGSEASDEEQPDVTFQESGGSVPPVGISFNRNQWMDLLKWAHHSGALSQDQRLKIVRMGRLIQKNRILTKKQHDQINEVLAFVYALGYRPQ